MPRFTPIALIEKRCKTETDLISADLRVVVALVAAKRTGRIGCTSKELMELTGQRHQSNMVRLERELWVVAVGAIEKSRERVWGPSPRAAARLGLTGWQTLLFSDDELERIDPNLPGFLEPLPERTVQLVGPDVADAGEREEADRVAS